MSIITRRAACLAAMGLGAFALPVHAAQRMRPNGPVRGYTLDWRFAGADPFRDQQRIISPRNMPLAQRRELVRRASRIERLAEQIPAGVWEALLRAMEGPPNFRVRHLDRYHLLVSGFPGYIEYDVVAYADNWAPAASRMGWVAFWTDPATRMQYIAKWHVECNNFALDVDGAAVKCRCVPEDFCPES